MVSIANNEDCTTGIMFEARSSQWIDLRGQAELGFDRFLEALFQGITMVPGGGAVHITSRKYI